MSQSLLDKESFNTLCTSVGLDYRLTKCLKKLGFQHPTLVQTKSLPLAITAGRDLLVRARTGSGKTLAYCLPILHKILKGEEKRSDTNDDGFVKAVILVPTKELCMQVTNTLNNLTFFCEDEITVGTLMAGSNASAAALAQQEAMLRDEPNIIISTPAGLLAHIRSEGSNLKSSMKHSVESLVVDEADLVLSFGVCSFDDLNL
jgi:ATP-dependent RNA helicase DDX56/DBP9